MPEVEHNKPTVQRVVKLDSSLYEFCIQDIDSEGEKVGSDQHILLAR